MMRALWIALLSVVITPDSDAQTDSLFRLPRIEGIIFDGHVDEPAWERIPPVPLVQYEPNAGAPPTEKTEIRFAYDDKYFYGSIRAYDRDPSGIRGNSLYRDRLAGSDHFEILLDAFNDNETAFVFSTTPAGIRNDVAIRNDATGGTISSGAWLNRDFNTFWDAEVYVNEEGWFAEMRIPFSSLRFQEKDGKVIMGLSAQRKVARKVERLIFPAIPPKQDWAFLRPSLAQKILIEGVHPTKTVYVSPYVLGGVERSNELDQGQTGYSRKNDTQLEIGGDVKFSVTNNLTMDFTVNTDFAQAEADDQQVNLTRFSLFFPEKRQFFQERAGIFEFLAGGLSRLFFSRRIGLTDDGRVAPIYGGMRMVGRVGTWDLGLLNMQTQKQDSIPSENFGVLRLRRRVFNPYSFAGGMFTSRLGADGSYNLAYGIDGLIRLFGDDYLTVQWAQTFDGLLRKEKPIAGFNSGRLALELNRRRREGVGYTVGTILSGPNYNPGIGFVDRSDFKYGTAGLSYTWLYNEGAPFIWQRIHLGGNAYLANNNGAFLSAEFGPEWSFSTRTLSSGGLQFKWAYENLLEDFVLSDDVSVPVGDYHFFRIIGAYKLAAERILSTGITLETGQFYDGWLHSIAFTPSWYVSKHLELGLEYSYNYVNFPDRDKIFKVHLARLRIGTAVNRKLSTNAFVQYNSTASLFSANVRFRYNFREGNDLWIVLNEGLNTDRYQDNLRLPLSSRESVLVKYVHTFQF
ncbi:MAG: carbohydrate binding family 9 domain-containing protein [Phaeodactylibacter sp.]|nr:carbohydrate binding family 9 domain-containing protein [Phaeodactylibacter sp.]